MTGARSKRRTPTGVWIALTVVAAVFLYANAHIYALELGAAQHDAFCPDHGWAVSSA